MNMKTNKIKWCMPIKEKLQTMQCLCHSSFCNNTTNVCNVALKLNEF